MFAEYQTCVFIEQNLCFLCSGVRQNFSTKTRTHLHTSFLLGYILFIPPLLLMASLFSSVQINILCSCHSDTSDGPLEASDPP